MRHVLFLVSMLTLSGCASLYTAKVAPARQAADAGRREELLDAAAAVLRERGFTVEAVEPAKGELRTAPAVQPGRVPCGMITCRYRDTVRVTVGADAAVSVQVLRELSSPLLLNQGVLLETWVEPSIWQKETVTGIETAQVDLLKEILR